MIPYRDDPFGAEVTEGALDEAGAAAAKVERAQVMSVTAEKVFIVFFF